MSEREATVRSAIVTYFPMVIAVLSLVTSIYNGWLNNKFVGIIQGNIGRVEYMRTCKEIIDAYFQVKFRAGVVSANGQAGATAGADLVEADNAVAKFAALGTYLANLREDAVREKYTELSRDLSQAVRDARRTPAVEMDKLFVPSDRIFTQMNDDCIKRAQQQSY